MLDSTIGHRVIRLDEVSSTNDYASELLLDDNAHGQVVVAALQTQGRGQRGNGWESKPGENLLFSILLKPSFLQVQRQFLLSKVAALAVCKTISTYLSNVTIKWPNDIYVGNEKIAGILIENSFSSAILNTSVVGIGVNVNQVDFSDNLPNPTSLNWQTGIKYNLDDTLLLICQVFDMYYRQLEMGEAERINAEYFDLLYRRKGYNRYMAKGEVFKAKIFRVRESGELVLETEQGELREFAFKEVSFVL